MNPSRLLTALDFAADKHRAQRRKSGEGVPYINHPIGVAGLLADIGSIEDENTLSFLAVREGSASALRQATLARAARL